MDSGFIVRITGIMHVNNIGFCFTWVTICILALLVIIEKSQ